MLTLAYPTTAMIRSMLKVWQVDLQPWSRPFPDYRRATVIFKPCACLQPEGCNQVHPNGGAVFQFEPKRQNDARNTGEHHDEKSRTISRIGERVVEAADLAFFPQSEKSLKQMTLSTSRASSSDTGLERGKGWPLLTGRHSGFLSKRAPEDLHASAGRAWTASDLDTDVVAAVMVHSAAD